MAAKITNTLASEKTSSQSSALREVLTRQGWLPSMRASTKSADAVAVTSRMAASSTRRSDHLRKKTMALTQHHQK